MYKTFAGKFTLSYDALHHLKFFDATKFLLNAFVLLNFDIKKIMVAQNTC